MPTIAIQIEPKDMSLNEDGLWVKVETHSVLAAMTDLKAEELDEFVEQVAQRRDQLHSFGHPWRAEDNE